MIAIPNMEKPKECDGIGINIHFTDGHMELHILDECELIEIAEPTETLIHDIRKLIAFIEPRMIIASTYAEQIERAEAVKDWLLSIIGERRTNERDTKKGLKEVNHQAL